MVEESPKSWPGCLVAAEGGLFPEHPSSCWRATGPCLGSDSLLPSRRVHLQ